MSAKNGTKKKKEGGGDPAFDLEQQFIMRLPPGPAAALRQEVVSGSMHLKDRLSIELQSDLRRGAIRYGNDFFYAKMVDLPSIIECHKTVDRKTFYKTADISQMLITAQEEDLNQDENESPKKKDKDKKFLWNHGITPPLKNVRKRRFRKTLKKKYMDQPDIEKEVKRLFRADADALSVKWELITEDEKPPGEEEDGGEDGVGTSGVYTRTDTGASLDIDIFGELSSSDDEDEKDVNIMDSEDDLMRQQNYLNMDSSVSQPQQAYLGQTGDQYLATTDDGQQSYLNMDGLVLENQEMNDQDQAEMQSQLNLLGQHLEDITRNMKEEADRDNEDSIETSYLGS